MKNKFEEYNDTQDYEIFEKGVEEFNRKREQAFEEQGREFAEFLAEMESLQAKGDADLEGYDLSELTIEDMQIWKDLKNADSFDANTIKNKVEVYLKNIENSEPKNSGRAAFSRAIRNLATQVYLKKGL